MNELERAAHEYAERGWPVFCCKPDSKAPDTPHGFKDATTDHARIQRWWHERAARNVAIATGATSIDVLDVDVRLDGSGFPAFDQLRAAGLLTGYQRVVATPSGGMHVYFAGSGLAGGSLPAQHLDFKAEGGYVLAPPSVVGGRSYQLEVDVPVPHGTLDWPAARRLLDPPPATPPRGLPARQPGGYGIDHLVRYVERQTEGSNNRNRGLFWAACRATEEGLDLRPLAEAALANGLSAAEVGRTLASATRTTHGATATPPPAPKSRGPSPPPGRRAPRGR